ncbi:MAG: hypothetical protein RLZZ214_3210 [Verrucomicrobiota bacterium]|jgi:hypothetical protein
MTTTNSSASAAVNAPQGSTIAVTDAGILKSKLLLPLHFNSKLHFDPDRDLHQLKNASPYDPARLPRGAKWYFDFLIPSRWSLVCTGRSFKSMRTCYRDEIDDDIEAYNFVVPGSMLSRTGMTIGDPAQGKLPRVSQRCNANTGPASYVVFRNPNLQPAGQAIRILGLSKHAGLVMAIETGRGGIEAWFSVVGWSETEIKNLRKTVVQHGSSGSTLSPSFPYAFPGGFCDRRGAVNKIIYFDPSAIGTTPNKSKKL